MKIREDCWLSAIFGHPVFKVQSELRSRDIRHGGSCIHDVIRDHGSRHPGAMYYAKIDADQIEIVRQLAAVGFYVVDVNVTFGIETSEKVDRPKPAGPGSHFIREIAAEHHEVVLQIAGSCFRYSRFHLDPLIPTVIANRIKHEWVLNYIRKQRGERLWVALSDGRPVSFLAVLASDAGGRRIRTIDLIGVDSAFQGRGIGQAVVAFFIDRYRGECDYLQVGTQMANLPSIRLYQRLGFSMVGAQYVMHMHVQEMGSRRTVE